MSDQSPITVAHPGQEDTTTPEVAFNYTDEWQVVKSLLDDFLSEKDRVNNRRSARRNRVNVLEARANPESPIGEDETIIPDRTIDRNVRQQSSPPLKFITQSPTVLSFYDLEQPALNFEEFSLYTTDIFRMGNWILPWFKIIDGSQVHGGAWFELVYDPSLPQQAAIEYIRRENLIVPIKVRDNLDTCDCFAREYEITKRQFNVLAKRFKFNEVVVHKIKEHYKNKAEFITIYKVFKRDENSQLFNYWVAGPEVCAESWLRDPAPHQMGLFNKVNNVDALGATTVDFQPIPVVSSPIFFVPMYAEEDESLLSIQGRAAIDLPAQEAITSVVTATVNASVRAAGFYPIRDMSAGPRTGLQNPMDNKGVVFKSNHVVEGGFNVFQPNWPNAIALSVIQAVAGRNSQDSGQVDFAAMSRQDTAKRATEIKAAVSEAEELSSVTLTLLSSSIRPAYVLWLNILKSAVMMKRINPPEKLLPFFDRVGSPALNITMSADTTVIRRAQRASRYVQNYAMVAGTPYADAYYKTMLRELFPEEFPDWERQVGETDQFKQALAQALQLMQTTPSTAVSPEMRQQYVQFIDAISQLLSTNPPAAVNNAVPAGGP